MSFLFLLIAIPTLAKGPAEIQGQQSQATTNDSQLNNSSSDTGSQPKNNQGPTISISPTKKTTVSPTGNQVKNTNEIQTQNKSEESQLNIKTKENEQLSSSVDESFSNVSDQVHQLIDTFGAKGGIGSEVKEIAQNQTKLQDEIKTTFNQLNSRSALAKFFFGSDKKNIQTMIQQMEQNRLLIQQLEELKIQTKNSEELKQFQETINSMISQNTSLQNKIDLENKSKGIFNWFINLFNIQ